MPALANVGDEDLLRRGRAARTAWLVLGLMLVAIGFIGIFVPLLPTTDFLLLALPCFARSSPRLEAWLLNHRRFGPSLRAWRAERAVPRHAKVAACIGMALGFGTLWLHFRHHPLLLGAVCFFILFWAIWIVRRPEPEATR